MEAANKESPFEERGKTNQELVGLLTSRGLGGEPSDILRALETVGYFRLKGYLFPLLKKGAADKSFADGATIGRAWELYTIDRKLRVMVFEALARIEVAIRALIVRSHLERNDELLMRSMFRRMRLVAFSTFSAERGMSALTIRAFGIGTSTRACRVALAMRQKSRRLRNVCERHPSRRGPRPLSRYHL